MSEESKAVEKYWPFAPIRAKDIPEPLKNLISKACIAVATVWVVASLILLADLLTNFFDGGATEADRFKEARTTVLILVALLGAPFVIWRTILAATQTEIAQQTHYTDLFTKAVDQLGATQEIRKDNTVSTEPSIEVRLGGIYALQRIAEESERDYLPIVKTLSAYVRQNLGEEVAMPDDLPPDPDWDAASENPIDADWDALREQSEKRREAIQDWGERLRKDAAEKGEPSAYRPDIRAALDVLEKRAPQHRHLELETGKLTPPPEPPPMELSGETGEEIRASAEKIRQDATTYRDRMETWRKCPGAPDLAGAVLHGADRPKARLHRFNFRGAKMQGANLGGARMQGANLGGARMQSTDMREASIRGSSLISVDFTDSNITQDQLDSAFGDASTILPEGLTAPDHWSKDDLSEDWEEAERQWKEWLSSRSS